MYKSLQEAVLLHCLKWLFARGAFTVCLQRLLLQMHEWLKLLPHNGPGFRSKGLILFQWSLHVLHVCICVFRFLSHQNTPLLAIINTPIIALEQDTGLRTGVSPQGGALGLTPCSHVGWCNRRG